MAQLYDVENGQGHFRFRRWYLDEVSGAMMPEDQAVRDYNGRLVNKNDVDEPDRDRLLEEWSVRAEDDPPGPDEDSPF